MTEAPPHEAAGAADGPRRLTTVTGRSDQIFGGVSRLAGFVVLAVMSLVGLFLLYRGWQALSADGVRAFVTTRTWEPDSHNFGIAAVLVLTIMIALVAITIAVPLATGAALYISEYAPRRFKQTLISMVDLMAAVPSIVYGIWGVYLLQPHVIGLSRWLATWLDWIPFLQVDAFDPDDPLLSMSVFTASTFIAGIVVALMITPIICSIMREVFSQAPPGEREGAYALGATRWGMIRSVVLPFGTGGMIGGSMLGLGRALGETIAVYLIISPVFEIQTNILQTGSNSISALIALRFGEATEFGMSALMAAGLTLFLMTLVVNFAASSIVARTRSGAASEA
ncbi:phosphate ABC transporter permease subunit PstC [Jiangella alkaliphila]|uniref:Phosphate transport system permease protein n=1 Tax=Jiangella alkaliphila TaxID=419479 RepID=A0A1H2KX13_9ACTN|nr:phosphate ABC transporter permease subunit PstC [Jiangella alkaliphila]SDU73014.1 phosphate ABC transporter membrane protein 1, PhoT family [Jiangella alkaliphila]